MAKSDLDQKKKKGGQPNAFLLDNFDIGMFATRDALATLQQGFAGWFSGLNCPARFICYQLPVSLKPKIDESSVAARKAMEIGATERAQLCQGYRRHFEELERIASYQASSCVMMLWTDDNPLALASGLRASLGVSVRPSDEYPALFKGQYRPMDQNGFWYLAPVGRGGLNRPYWAICVSFDWMPSEWTFWKPLPPLLQRNYPMAVAIDISETFDRNTGVDKVEAKITEYKAHLATSKGEDSRAIQRINDCYATLKQLNEGDLLHTVEIVVAVAANTVAELKTRVGSIINEVRPWFKLRREEGELLSHSARVFTLTPRKEIKTPETIWPVTSREASLMLAPLGFPKLSSLRGVLRGDSKTGGYPLFHDSWNDKHGRPDKRAVHEIWVGVSGFGKTYMCNCYLSREYALNGVPFDLLEPMGHGKHVASAFNLPWLVISSKRTRLNPLDVMMETMTDQVSHVIRLMETMTTRNFTGNRDSNIERGLLGEAIEKLYSQYPSLESIEPSDAPTCDDLVNALFEIGNGYERTKPRNKQIARDLADEIAALCTGRGPFAGFVNGRTNFDLSFRNNSKPRIFSFHEMEGDPILLALAYTQVLSAIRRDSLSDENPRIIAVDEVYRLMRHPSLLDFLVEAYKTFRTRRKKLIAIDQQMSVFLEGKARFLFENSPIKVIFNQRQGLNVFKADAAFQHYNDQHREIIAGLPRFCYLLDIQDEGIWFCENVPSSAENARFKTT